MYLSYIISHKLNLKIAESSPKGLKTQWENRNCSQQAISTFPTVFSSLVLQTGKNQGLFGIELCKVFLFSLTGSVLHNPP